MNIQRSCRQRGKIPTALVKLTTMPFGIGQTDIKSSNYYSK